MRFHHYGKTYQLRIENARDLADVLRLDESLWVATSAPIQVFRCDAAFIRFLDSNGDGRINTREVRGAIRWLLACLKDTSALGPDSGAAPLRTLRDDTPETKALLDSAHRALASAPDTERDTIDVEAVRRFLEELRTQPMNGDGVIIPRAAPDENIAQYIRDAIAGTGGTDDSSGEQGITAAHIDQFQSSVPAYLDWLHDGALPEGSQTTDCMPFGNETPALYNLFTAHADQVDLFFGLCRATRFDPRTQAHFGCTDAELQALDLNTLNDIEACLAAQPIARPRDDARLPLHENAVNPLYRLWIAELRARLVPRVLDADTEFLDEDAWQRIEDRLAPYAAYLAAKPAAELDPIPVDRLRGYLDPSFAAAAQRMIQADRNVTAIRDAARNLERFVLYHRHLVRFVNNFVNFSQLYALQDNAIFEMGSAVIDGRWFNMALKVEDLAAHTQIAATSNVFTMYVEVSGKQDDTTFLVAIPATSGTKGNLSVGKRGIFFDTEDREYNARIVKIIENPISLREALLSPFVRLWDFVVGKIERMAGSSETDLQKKTDTLISTPPSAAAQTANGPAGMLVGLSLSAAAIGSALAFVAKTLTDMKPMEILFSVLGALLVVAIPVTLIAVIKLRRQDLSSLLEGCGWAVNARMRFNRAQRYQFTRRVPLPAHAEGTRRHRWRPLLLLAVLAALIAWFFLQG